jgi:hypothetical protein
MGRVLNHFRMVGFLVYSAPIGIKQRLECTALDDASGFALDRLETRAAIAKTARKLADAFKNDNRNFRYDKFFAACGLDPWAN